MAETDDDRRNYKRVPAQLIAHFRKAPEGKDVDAKATNVSQGGVFIETRIVLEEGDTVQFDMIIPQEKGRVGVRVSIVGEVRWRHVKEPMGVGVRILEMTTKDKMTMKRFMVQQDNPHTADAGKSTGS